MKIALLGTGKMGAAIARRLDAAGHQVELWNRTPERARAVGVGSLHRDPGEAAASAELVMTIVTDPRAAADVYSRLEPRDDQVYVEMSTIGPDAVEALASRFTHLLAAPILGSVPAIEAGTALVLVGGAAADYARAEPAIRAFGEPRHAGTRRQAAALKLVNNAMFGTCSAVAAELQAMGERAGLDAETVFGILERTMPYLKARKRGYTDHDHSAPLFFLRDLVKDLDLALALGHGGGATTPLVGLARELYAAAALERPTDEITALIERY